MCVCVCVCVCVRACVCAQVATGETGVREILHSNKSVSDLYSMQEEEYCLTAAGERRRKEERSRGGRGRGGGVGRAEGER